MPLEKPVLPVPGVRRLLSDLGGVYALSALIAFLFAASGPVAIILSVGRMGGLSESDVASWMFGSFFLNGLITIAMCLLYRQPLVLLWTIPGAVLVGPALTHLSFAEVIGAYHATGLLLLVLGVSGWIRRASEAVPLAIVMAMVAGVFLRFGVDLVLALRDDFWIAAPMVATFFALGVSRAWARRLPPLLGALAAGALAVALTDTFAPPAGALFQLARPELYVPVFSWRAIIELVLPLAITVLAAQNAQGFAVLAAAGHRPPISAVTTACGIGSIVVALVGAVSTCLTGPVNAIITGAGERARQYTAGVLMGVLVLGFGLAAPFFTRLLLATPAAFIATLAGLAMLRVLERAFVAGFGGRFTLGALVSFVVTVADVPIAGIGAPFWALVFGFAASWLLERDDFRQRAADSVAGGGAR